MMRYCVDAICKWYNPINNLSHYVLIKRLSFPQGLALIGGGIEEGEKREDAIVREVKEESGLTFEPLYWLAKTYDKEGRDPRGRVTSYVAVGIGRGEIKEEEGKTKVILLSLEEMLRCEDIFVFDHKEIIRDYVTLRNKIM